jgi:hypothetical protein
VYLATISIRKYVHHSLNYENILYWGLSFVLFSISSILHIVAYFIANDAAVYTTLDKTIISLDNLATWLSLYAISYVINACPNYNTKKCEHCKICKRKMVRVGVWSVLILSTILTSICKVAHDSHIISIIYQIIMLCAIAVMLLKYKRFHIHLYIAYSFYCISKIFALINIFVNHELLMQKSLALWASGIIITFSEITKLINKED